jgi:hypothetical protein
MEILSDTMRRGLSEYEIDGHVAWLQGTLILLSVGSGRGAGRRHMDGTLSLGLGARRRNQRRRHLSDMGGSTSGIREVLMIYGIEISVSGHSYGLASPEYHPAWNRNSWEPLPVELQRHPPQKRILRPEV